MSRTVLALLLSTLLGSGSACADGLSAERVRSLVARGEILPLEDILKRNEANLGGRVIEIEIEAEHGTYLYEIKVLRPDGRYRELQIDARTGALMRED